MQGNDHLALAMDLLRSSRAEASWYAQMAFLIGCLEPDINFVTYLRSPLSHRAFRGHNAENSRAHVLSCLNRLGKRELRTARDYFALGTVIHYLADAFTHPHNDSFPGDLRAHISYERELHAVFSAAIGEDAPVDAIDWPESAALYYRGQHVSYRAANQCPENDCAYILKVSRAIFRKLTERAAAREARPVSELSGWGRPQCRL